MSNALFRLRLLWGRLKSILFILCYIAIGTLIVFLNIKLNVFCFRLKWEDGKPPAYFILLLCRFILFVSFPVYIYAVRKRDYKKIKYIELINYFEKGTEILKNLKITDEYINRLNTCTEKEAESVLSLVWSGLSQEEQRKHEYAFDGVDDRKDLLKIMEKRKVSLLSAIGYELEGIRLWYGVNVRNIPKLKEREPLVKIQKKENPDEILKLELVKAFGQYGVTITPSGAIERGPAVVRVPVKLEPGTKLSKATGLEADIAAALGKQSIRIAAIPGEKSTVGVEIPRDKPEKVLYRDLLPALDAAQVPLPFALGRTISGGAVIGDLDGLPHLLIAGTTGSGKSVCMNSLIVSLLHKFSPAQLRLIMIDPKMVELAPYGGLPHLTAPVVTDIKKASAALQTAVDEMMRRYAKFKESGVREIKEYNSKHEEIFPRLVVVVDELADLMLTAKKEVEPLIVRIAQMGRAAGVHLVIATQRPSADVITGLIKTNIPSRIAFAVPSQIDSRIILDAGGAEKLVGRGDMLYAPLGKRERVQGCYIGPEEIEKAVKEAAKRGNRNGTGGHGEAVRPLRDGDSPQDAGNAQRTV